MPYQRPAADPDAGISDEERCRRKAKAIAARLREGTETDMDRYWLASWLDALAKYKYILTATGQRARRTPAPWVAYHAVLRERQHLEAREYVASYWSRSPETVQDDLTNWREWAEDNLEIHVQRGIAAGFTEEGVLAGEEEVEVPRMLCEHKKSLKSQARREKRR